jgi:Major Facilitator Superfamily
VRSRFAAFRLRRIIGAYTINRLGTWFGLVALLTAVFDHTHSAIAVAALLFAWQALPAFVVPALVARVEASSRRGELSGLYFFEAAATVALAVFLAHFWLPIVLLLAMLDGTAALTASALLRAEVARTARDQAARQTAQAPRDGESLEEIAREAERKANAELNVAFSGTFVAGPVLGGVAVAGAGATAALLVDAASFLVCGALLVDLHPHVEEATNTVRARLRTAWQHINEAPLLRGLLVADLVALVFFNSAGPIEVTYAKATLHAGDRGFGLLLTMWGAGAVLGSLIFARSPRRSIGAMLSAGALGIGLAYIGFAAAPSLVLACAAAFTGGVGNGLELPSLFSLVQQLTPQDLHGRLMGAVESLTALSVAIGLPLGGALVALSSSRVAFLVVGVGTTAAAAALLRTSRRPARPTLDAGATAPAADGLQGQPGEPEAAWQSPLGGAD